MLLVKPADVAQDRKRRIINDNTVIRVVVVLKVTAGEEWADDLSAFQSVSLNGPVFYAGVYIFQRIAVIRCFLGLELIHKLIVFGVLLALIVSPEVLSVLSGLPGCRSGIAGHLDLLDRLRIKTDDAGVKLQGLQTFQFDLQGLGVPGGGLAQAVVRQDVRLSLGLGQIADKHAGHLCHALRPGGLHPAMAGDDVVVEVDEHRRHEAKLPQAGPQLRDLLLVVDLGVVRVRHQVIDRDQLQLLRRHPHRVVVSVRCRVDAALTHGPAAGAFLLCHTSSFFLLFLMLRSSAGCRRRSTGARGKERCGRVGTPTRHSSGAVRPGRLRQYPAQVRRPSAPPGGLCPIRTRVLCGPLPGGRPVGQPVPEG